MLRVVNRGDPHPMSTSPPVAPSAGDIAPRIAALRHRVDGDVLTPGDHGFGDAMLALEPHDRAPPGGGRARRERR